MWMELKGLLLKTKKYNSAKRKRGKKLWCEWTFQETIAEQRCAHFCFARIGRKLTVQSAGSHRGSGGGIQIPET